MANILAFIQKHWHHPTVAALRNVQSLGLVIFAVIVLLVSWSGVGAIQSNYKLQQEIARLQQENTVAELQNQNQKLKNDYYKTPQYLELAARQNFGLATPGEKELLVPREVAMAQVAGVKAVGTGSGTVASDDAVSGESASDAAKRQPFYQRNMQAWMNFFLHRSDAAT